MLRRVHIGSCTSTPSPYDGEYGAYGKEDNPPCASEAVLLNSANQTRPTVLILSGCYWSAEGGAQRPVALARELANLDFNVVYHNSDPRQKTEYVDGVLCVGEDTWSKYLLELTKTQGVVLPTYPAPNYVRDVFTLRRAGWRVGYDILDDWEGFFSGGDLTVGQDQFIIDERALVAISDFVTCSAHKLMEIAVDRGNVHPVLIRNGGPAKPFTRRDPPADMAQGKIKVIYVGCLAGSWFDWELLKKLDYCEDLAVTVIGKLENGERRWPHYVDISTFERVKFLGEKPYNEAMKYVAAADVGIIPFRDPAICEGVDPIKRWDYAAAGLWTVATPELREMHDAEYVTLTRKNWPAAIRKAFKQQHKPGKEYVSRNSWKARGRALAKQVTKALARSSRAVQPLKPTRVVRGYFEWNLRVTWAGPSTCNANPICPYCCTAYERSQRHGTFPVPVDELQDALVRFTYDNGPCLLSVCWGESMVNDDMARIVGAVGEFNRVDLVTNLVFPLERLRFLENKENFALCTSFHPQLFNNDVYQFISKRKAVEAAGIHCGVTEIVAYPDYLPYIPEWVKVLTANECNPSLLPFNGWHEPTKKFYPASYTEDEWRLIKGGLILIHEDKDFRDGILDQCESPKGKMCTTGMRYVYLDWTGTVRRCVIPQHEGPDILGNIFTGYQLLAEPAPCGGDGCPCADLWQFIV